MMRKQNWLCVLHVSSTWNRGSKMLFGTCYQNRNQLKNQLLDDVRFRDQVHANQGGNLIISGPTSTELSAKFSPCDFD
jgi:hypothetical protein